MGRHVAPRTPRRWKPPVIIALVLITAAVPTLITGTGTAAVEAPPVIRAAPDVTAPADHPTDFPREPVTLTTAPPHPGMGLTEFLAIYEGTRTVLPGYSTAECMAIFSHYNYTAVLGDSYSAPGAQDLWLSNSWTAYDRIPAAQPAQPGDVVIWSGHFGAYQGGGYGHVAIVVKDLGADLAAFGQNPNAATTLTLSKHGVLGYLRPRHLNP